MINYNWLSNNKAQRQALKKIVRTQKGHKVFNPFKKNESFADVQTNVDRAFTGWLYGDVGVTEVFKTGSVFKYDAILGIVGPAALGKEIQQGWHQFLGLYDAYGWELQVKNEIGLNVSAEYNLNLLQDYLFYKQNHSIIFIN